MEFVTDSPEQTWRLAYRLAKLVNAPICIALNGSLGAGKTQFTKGFAQGCCVTEEVTSPTFALMNEYEGSVNVLHIDVYRLEEEELFELGIEEQIEEWDGAVLVEWSSLHPSILPLDHLDISIQILSPEKRLIKVSLVGNIELNLDVLNE